MKIAAFGFRSLPSVNGSAGADKFAEELLPRLVQRGHQVIAYNRKYKNAFRTVSEYKGVKIKSLSTINKKGLDTLLHSFKCTWDIIVNNTAQVVHIQNGGNSIWALFMKLAGKKVFISQDGVDWKRDKWPWYGKAYLKLMACLSAYVPDTIIFDNVISQSYFEKKFHKKFEFVPFGSEVPQVADSSAILERFGLQEGEFYLFVGRFIPDKGIHYLIPGFQAADTGKKLVLVGGSPNPSGYEMKLKSMAGENVVFTGFLYGDDVVRLMRYCYCYIQPSDVEGLSPVVLTVMGLGVPLIVSDIEENMYAVENTSLTFCKSNISSLTTTIQKAEANYCLVKELAVKAKQRALKEFNWEAVADQHIAIFNKYIN